MKEEIHKLMEIKDCTLHVNAIGTVVQQNKKSIQVELYVWRQCSTTGKSVSYGVLIIAKAYKLSWFLVGFTAGGVMGFRVKMSRSHRDVFLSVAYFFKKLFNG